MYQKTLIAVAVAVAAAAPAYAQRTGTAAGDIAIAVPANSRFIPMGTTIKLTLDDNLSTMNKVGEGVNLTVSEDVMAQDGSVAIPAGTMLQGRLTGVYNAQSAGQPSVVRVNFDDLGLKGQHYPFSGGVVHIDVVNPPQGSPVGSIVTDAAARQMVSQGQLTPGPGTVLLMGPMAPQGDGIIPKGSVFTVRSMQGIQVK